MARIHIRLYPEHDEISVADRDCNGAISGSGCDWTYAIQESTIATAGADCELVLGRRNAPQHSELPERTSA